MEHATTPSLAQTCLFLPVPTASKRGRFFVSCADILRRPPIMYNDTALISANGVRDEKIYKKLDKHSLRSSHLDCLTLWNEVKSSKKN
jgi:hypothetical protein